MNRNIISLVLTTAIALPLLSSIAPVHSQTAYKPKVITFFCDEIMDKSSGKPIWTTFAWLPDRTGSIAIISWKSQFFAKYQNTQQRCESATLRFQTASDTGHLQYLTAIIPKGYGYPVICALAKTEDVCDSNNNMLFELVPNEKPFQALQQLMNLLAGKPSDILVQGSGGREYIFMPEFFNKAPIHDRDSPCKIKGMGANLRCKPSRKQH